MKVLLIALNLLAAGLIFPAMTIVDGLYFIKSQFIYVELDRAQAIDQDKIKEHFPAQSENDRVNIPKLLFYRGLTPITFIGYPCILGFILNAILIGIFWKQKITKAEQDA